jgi:signal-transduction protein with cAMP-binding, CBS, and nucleotidyltransferase domain
MGLFGTLISFGAGYVAGMKLGERPLDAAKKAAGEMTGRATGSTVDVRQVREVMTSNPESVSRQTTLKDAAATMARASIGDVLVVDDDGKLNGILTDRDIAIRGVAEGLDPATTTVGEITSGSVMSVSPTASVNEAMDVMHRHDVRRVPVVESGKAVGIVSLGDLSTSRAARGVLADISTAPPNN